MDGELIILGCGGSSGVPAIGNWWGKCDPAEPRNRRTRPSIALLHGESLAIVDTGPDFKEQMNRENLVYPDGIIITHTHADHINGLDELRTLQRIHKKGRIPVYASTDTHEKLFRRLDYMFTETENGFYPAVCDQIHVTEGDVITVGDLKMTCFDQNHGSIKSLGLRIGNIGYSTDVLSLEDRAYDILRGIDTWIVDAASYHGPAYVHAGLQEVFEMNKRVQAKHVYLTHLSPTMDYAALCAELPEGYMPAHDGLRLKFTF
ncbi:MAG: MBL fold metallo-hydrolase [Micavibrio sp.]